MADSMPAYKEVAVVFTSAFIIGMYLITLLFCFRWLLFDDEGWKLRRHISWLSVIGAFLIFAFNLVYLVLSLSSTMAMVRYLSGHPDGPGYRSPPWDPVVKCSSENITILLADCILMHRCWTVYGKRLVVIIFPALLWLGGILFTALQMYLQIVHTHNALVGSRTWGKVNMSIGPGIVIMPFLASTIVLNGYTAYMLIRRIYQVATKCDTATSARRFRFVIRILAESGFLYLSITTAQFVAWFTTDDVAVQVLSMINLPMIGIAFDLVLIRAAQKRAEEDVLEEQPITQVSELHFGRSSFKSV